MRSKTLNNKYMLMDVIYISVHWPVVVFEHLLWTMVFTECLKWNPSRIGWINDEYSACILLQFENSEYYNTGLI